MSKADELLTTAMARTDAEIFAEAMDDSEPDEGTDKSLEEMSDDLDPPEGDEEESDGETGDESEEGDESKAGERDEAKGAEGEADKGKTPEPEEPKDAKGLRAALGAERKARQAAETAAEAARTESREALKAMNDRLDKALSAISPAAPKAADTPEAEEPDPWIDPKAYRESVVSTVTQQMTLRRVAETFADAHEAHGKEFEAANAELGKLDRTSPVDRATVQRIASAPNPGKALMSWHRQQVTLREVGADPAAYKARVREELLKDPETRKAVLAATREEARQGGGAGTPRTITKLPPSLNSARGGSSARVADPSLAGDNSDKAVFDYAMKD